LHLEQLDLQLFLLRLVIAAPDPGAVGITGRQGGIIAFLAVPCGAWATAMATGSWLTASISATAAGLASWPAGACGTCTSPSGVCTTTTASAASGAASGAGVAVLAAAGRRRRVGVAAAADFAAGGRLVTAMLFSWVAKFQVMTPAIVQRHHGYLLWRGQECSSGTLDLLYFRALTDKLRQFIL